MCDERLSAVGLNRTVGALRAGVCLLSTGDADLDEVQGAWLLPP
eukprot:COSAG06_NODE_65998_length_255_cov_0.993590_1_plen_43_part_10